MQIIKVDDLDNRSVEDASINTPPNECPVCHNKINPVAKGGVIKKMEYSRKMQVVFLCPSDKCNGYFISYYSERTSGGGFNKAFFLEKSEPRKIDSINFSEIVSKVSPKFSVIYNQAHKAEEMKLRDVCGAGYRKALEFLIKDYLIGLDEGAEEKVKKEKLGRVISNRIDHDKIKEVAKRATWLGNDETHYERRWKDKDLKDLKILIDLTIRWIEMEKMTEEVVGDMK